MSDMDKHDVEKLRLHIENISAENESLKQDLQVLWLFECFCC